MAMGGPGSRKGGQGECKACASAGRQEIDAMILNATPYPAIIARMKQLYPNEPVLIPSNLTKHKQNHLLNNPITRVVEAEDGTREIQTYLTGQYEAMNIVIPPEAVPQIPDLSSALKIIIAAGLHNVLNNPALVSPDKLLLAIQELRKLGGGTDDMDKFLGAWEGVGKRKEQIKKAKRTRTVSVTDEVEMPVEQPTGEVVDAEWSAAELDNLALPAPGGSDG